jgi:hypothetical protein
MTTLDARVPLLRSRIADANRMLKDTELEMGDAVSQLAPAPTGDKRMSSVQLDQAFRRLKGARALVADLEAMLATALATPRA